jgi:hypothetical protein
VRDRFVRKTVNQPADQLATCAGHSSIKYHTCVGSAALHAVLTTRKHTNGHLTQRVCVALSPACDVQGTIQAGSFATNASCCDFNTSSRG